MLTKYHYLGSIEIKCKYSIAPRSKIIQGEIKRFLDYINLCQLNEFKKQILFIQCKMVPLRQNRKFFITFRSSMAFKKRGKERYNTLINSILFKFLIFTNDCKYQLCCESIYTQFFTQYSRFLRGEVDIISFKTNQKLIFDNIFDKNLTA